MDKIIFCYKRENPPPPKFSYLTILNLLVTKMQQNASIVYGTIFAQIFVSTRCSYPVQVLPEYVNKKNPSSVPGDTDVRE